MTDAYCYDCEYFTPYDQVCNYNLVTGYSRRCPAGEGCTKKKPTKKRKVKDFEYHRNLGKYHSVRLAEQQGIIKEYRKRHKLSLRAFAELVGRGRQTVCDWERGWYHCPPEILEKVKNDEQF